MNYVPNFYDVIPMVKSAIYANKWRFERTMEDDDLFQEAGFQYTVMVKRANNKNIVFENKSHFLVYFRQGLYAHFNTLSNKDTSLKDHKRTCDLASIDKDENLVEFEFEGDKENYGYFECLIESAPPEIKEILSILLSTDSEVIKKAFKQYKKMFNVKNSEIVSNEFLCYMIGEDPNYTDLIKKIKAYFS